MTNVSRTRRRRIGEILLDEGIITKEELQEALSHQRKSRGLLGTILRDMGLVTESDIAKIICLQYQLPFISLANYDYDKTVVDMFPAEFLHGHRLLPFDKIGNTLLTMVTEVPSEKVLAEIPKLTGHNVALYVGYDSEVVKHLDILRPLKRSEDGTPIFSSDEMLEDLDSTWDSIFEQLGGEDGDESEEKTEEPNLF